MVTDRRAGNDRVHYVTFDCSVIDRVTVECSVCGLLRRPAPIRAEALLALIDKHEGEHNTEEVQRA